MIIGLISLFFAFSVSAQTSPDAIAIRVIPNYNYYSPLRWYQEQGFSGSPQSITIDGYEAVRDGRTVYVNAANIDLNSNSYYANIYLISYNQDAESATVDIFSRILKRWKFNTNIIGTGFCSNNTTQICVTDDDCGGKGYCSSFKARVVRDTLRLSDFADIKTYLSNYYANNGNYPILSAGTYIANSTISTWPSWRDNLSQELGAPIPVDPINKLGACPGYDSVTCWNESATNFADPTPADSQLNLPNFSYAYSYTASSTGDKYNLCANMETGSTFANLAAFNCAGNIIANSPPSIANVNLPIEAPGAAYNGFIEAVDPDGDILTWTINTAAATWTGWSAAPILRNAGIFNQRTVYAAAAGNIGAYDFYITIDDGRGGIYTNDPGNPNYAGGDPPYTINIAAASSCADADTDGYGVCPNCDMANGCRFDGNDCDDNDGRRNPGNSEVCDDGFDNNCDQPNEYVDCADPDCSTDSACGVQCADGYCDMAQNECSQCPSGGDCAPSDCCGDMVIDLPVGEECDDGNNVNDDGCDNNCKKTYCGDNIIQNNPYNGDFIIEQCDFGDTVNGDGCDSNCQIESISCATTGACDGFCPLGCLPADDPDCGCTYDNNCCGVMCTFYDDNDCPSICGDNYCDTASEDCASCSFDCGICYNPCGDNFCDSGIGEDCATCPDDCGICCVFPFTFPCVFN